MPPRHSSGRERGTTKQILIMQSHVTVDFLESQGLSASFPKRFFDKIITTQSCWIWNASKLKRGYGQIGRWRNNDRPILAHRASWILHFGEIPVGLQVLHNCPDGDNPSCVNPAHLWLGTANDNMKDAASKGRVVNIRWKNPMNNCHRKLDWEKVDKIRLWKSEGVRLSEIANRMNVTKACIESIVYRGAWKVTSRTA